MGMPFRRLLSLSAALITIAALLAPAAALGDPPPPNRATPSGSAPAAPSGPASAPTEQAAPTTIPVPEVARRADEVAKLVRELDALLVPGPMIDAIKKQLPDSVARVNVLADDTIAQLDGEPSAATLDGLTEQWQTTRAVLSGHVNVLAARATAIEEAQQRLSKLREVWTRARADARETRAPAQVIARIDSVLMSIGTTASEMQAQRAATLVLQDGVARELAACEVMIDKIASFRRATAGQLLERTGVPFWSGRPLATGLAELPRRVAEAATDEVVRFRYFTEARGFRATASLALFLVLTLIMYGARRRTRKWAASREIASAAAAVFERPVSAALMLTIGTSALFSPPAAPPVAVSVFQLLALVPALRLMRVFLPAEYGPALYMLGALFPIDMLRRLGSVVPLLEQVIFLIEMLAAVAVLAWWMLTRRPSGNVGLAARALLLVFVTSLAAAAAGYTSAGLLLGAGVLGSGYLALIVYVSARVAAGLVTVGLQHRPLSDLVVTRRHRALVERRVRGVIHLIAFGTWVMLTLRYFGLRGPAMDLARSVVGAEYRRGNLTISVGDLLVFALTVGGTFVLSRLLRFVLQEELYPRVGAGRGFTYAVSGLLYYVLIFAGFLVGLATLGVDLTKITILAGAFGVGIGFGLQNIVNNIVSGLILLFERRIDLGDAVQIGDVAGRVEHMGVRACVVRTWEGAEVIVPNASLTSEKVTNWTLSDRLRRIDVAVGVAYGTPPEKVTAILLGVARAHKEILLEPEPLVLLRAFGDSALQFEIRVWTDHFDTWLRTQSELTMAVHEALRDANIEIPFPQREIRVRS
ncbi:MAG TPA: mechanosensitive ion channel domain-containing protein [Methylomirabilota bacterium]